jgi:hypothetical protein
MVMMYALIAFAVAFILVGVLRVVEFKAVGLSRIQERILIPLHFIGCIGFAAATVMLAIDESGVHHRAMTFLFFGSVLVLFPIHIFINIKRRIRMTK